jgi:Protein of unknown function (DUF3710)
VIFGRKKQQASPTEPDPADEADEWIAFDESEDWREEGPFDIDEVDLEADDIARLDLGALIVTPEEGMQIQIIADAETGNGLALVLSLDGAAMQVEVKAAPQSGGFAAEVRDDIIEGEDSFAPLRDWLVEGPRWLLVARMMGEAAIDVAGDGASQPFDEAFRNLIVRRGDEPMAPGQTVPLKVPEG